ncbi:NK3R-like protein [Mya arenaria]|uniref:NK3R-like protein n=1 Tax=Mya arenaria TaxID=6604 RepID=A0ABY7DNP1_MYAAR|nr:NK3R-like protein [Mya arenaria]
MLIIPLFSVLCLTASVLSLTLIAYDRFFGIVFALKAHMSHRKARFSIAIIWICSFAIAAPLLWFRELKVREWKDYTERWCDDSWPIEMKTVEGTNTTIEYMPARTVYFTFVSGVLYFFPILVMTLAYSVIILKLQSSTIPGERVDSGYAAQQKTRRKVIAMLVTIMAVFAICWLPYQIVLLYSELRTNRETLGEWYFTMQFLAGCFAYSNSALNPLIYAGFNKNFKQAIVNTKADFNQWGKQSMNTIASPLRRMTLPFLGLSPNSNESRLTTSSARSSPSRSVLILKGGSTARGRTRRGLSVDFSPQMAFFYNNPRRQSTVSPTATRESGNANLQYRQTIRSWQPKYVESDHCENELSPSPLFRCKTQRRYKDVIIEDETQLQPLRRNSINTLPLRNTSMSAWYLDHDELPEVAAGV